MKKFVLWADTRTGSSSVYLILKRTIDNLRDSAWPEKDKELTSLIPEPYNPNTIGGNRVLPVNLFNVLYGCDDTDTQYLWGDDRQFNPLQECDMSIINKVYERTMMISYGFKHIWSHLDVWEPQPWVAESGRPTFRSNINYSLLLRIINDGYKIIFLERSNVPKKCLSHMLAQQTNDWGMYGKNGPKIPTFTDIDIDKLSLFCDRYRARVQEYREYLSHVDDVYYLTYEQLFNLKTYDERILKFYEILDFLEIDRLHLNDVACKQKLADSARQNTNELLLTIPNVNDLNNFAKHYIGPQQDMFN